MEKDEKISFGKVDEAMLGRLDGLKSEDLGKDVGNSREAKLRALLDHYDHTNKGVVTLDAYEKALEIVKDLEGETVNLKATISTLEGELQKSREYLKNAAERGDKLGKVETERIRKETEIEKGKIQADIARIKTLGSMMNASMAAAAKEGKFYEVYGDTAKALNNKLLDLLEAKPALPPGQKQKGGA